jgi:hypothetical protein
MTPRRPVLAGLTIALVLGVWPLDSGARAADVPGRLSDADFWRLTDELSEPSGYFRSENLVSNEVVFARVLPPLVRDTKPGGVYLGVGPEQNFTYIAAMRPRMAFIIDIRRGNLLLHLMYKALFELSADRADFVGWLFTKPRPAGLTEASTARDLMNAYWDVTTSNEDVYERNLAAIRDLLVKKHGFALSPDDLQGLAFVYRSFYWFGPVINWSSSANGASGGRASFVDLMTQADADGRELSFLATENSFQFLKDLEARNLIVPVVGNFGGPKAIRAVGKYVRDAGATVSAFYLSNVETYLRQDSLWTRFCNSSATLPIDAASLFIRPGLGGSVVFRVQQSDGTVRMVSSGPVPGLGNGLGNMLAETRSCGSGF